MTDKSSILLLGRNSVIFGAIVIFVISMGIGYFLGYKGSGFGKTDKQDLEHGLPLPPPAAPEDKKILEPAPAGNAPVLKDTPKPAEPEPAAPAAAEKKPSGPAAKKDEKTPALITPPETPAVAAKEKAEEAAPSRPEEKEKEVRVKPAGGKHAAQKTKKGAPSGKAFAVQFGAFPSKSGALQLQAALKAKGVSSYLVGKTKNDPYYRVRTGAFKSRKEAEHGAKALEKKTGLNNFVTLK